MPDSKSVPTFTPEQCTEARAFLDKEGYVVMHPIFDPARLSQLNDLYWQALQSINPCIDRERKETWINAEFPGEYSTGILGYYGLPQSDYMWELRKSPTLLHIFADFHGVSPDDMCVSLDAMICMFSHKNKKASWLHRDQVPGLEGGELLSLQGIWMHGATGPHDAGFCCVPGSHIQPRHDGPLPKRHYDPLPADAPEHQSSCKILTPENSCIVFNSRLLHCNTAATRDRPPSHVMNSNPVPQLNRQGGYISYFPKIYRSPLVLEKKKALYKKGQGTSHWAPYAHKKSMMPRYPRTARYTPMKKLEPTLVDGEIPKDRLHLL